MSIDPTAIATFLGGSLTLGVGRLAYNVFTGSQQADDRSRDIYKGLNEALENKVTTLQEDLKEALARLEAMDAKITKLTEDNAFFDRIFSKALAEYFENHPDVANEHNRRRVAR